MSQDPKVSQEKILGLLRSLPQPGEILLDAVGDGIAGFSVKPSDIPQKLTGKDVPWYVSLQLVKGGEIFGEERFLKLMTRSLEWEKLISDKPVFVIRSDDAGKEIDVVLERQKNFNRNLLHEFLGQLSVTVGINKEYHSSILNSDNYPMYFWERPVSVLGAASASNMLLIKATVNGVSSCPEIKMEGSLYLKYWKFLSDEQRPFMNVVLKWHKALISLLHLIKCDGVVVPIDFEKMERDCWEEINATAKL